MCSPPAGGTSRNARQCAFSQEAVATGSATSQMALLCLSERTGTPSIPRCTPAASPSSAPVRLSSSWWSVQIVAPAVARVSGGAVHADRDLALGLAPVHVHVERVGVGGHRRLGRVVERGLGQGNEGLASLLRKHDAIAASRQQRMAMGRRRAGRDRKRPGDADQRAERGTSSHVSPSPSRWRGGRALGPSSPDVTYGSENSCVCGLKCPSFSAPAVCLPLNLNTFRPFVISDS